MPAITPPKIISKTQAPISGRIIFTGPLKQLRGTGNTEGTAKALTQRRQVAKDRQEQQLLFGLVNGQLPSEPRISRIHTNRQSLRVDWCHSWLLSSLFMDFR